MMTRNVCTKTRSVFEPSVRNTHQKFPKGGWGCTQLPHVSALSPPHHHIATAKHGKSQACSARRYEKAVVLNYSCY